MALIKKAVEQQQEERIYQQWLVQLPVMALTGKYIPLEEYRAKMTGENIDKRPTSVILAELDEIEKEFSREEESS